MAEFKRNFCASLKRYTLIQRQMSCFQETVLMALDLNGKPRIVTCKTQHNWFLPIILAIADTAIKLTQDPSRR